MSVIPFIIEGTDRTIVETREEFEAAGGLGGKVMLIQNLDRGQFLSKGDTNASYDLRIGCAYRDHRDAGKTELSENGYITLLPSSAVIIQTEECVHFPKSTFGHIVPKVSLLQKGISNTSSKVDPGYIGHLLITVFNLGKKTVTLKKGDPFCTLYVLQVLEGVRPYDKVPKALPGVSKRGIWQGVRDLIERNPSLLTLLLIIATFVLVICQIIEFLLFVTGRLVTR